MTLPSEDRAELLRALRRVDHDGFRGEVRAVLLAHGEVASAAAQLRIAADELRAWIAEDPSLVEGLELDG